MLFRPQRWSRASALLVHLTLIGEALIHAMRLPNLAWVPVTFYFHRRTYGLGCHGVSACFDLFASPGAGEGIWWEIVADADRLFTEDGAAQRFHPGGWPRRRKAALPCHPRFADRAWTT